VAMAGGRIDAVFFCPHAADAECPCRKPQAGMFREIAERYHTDLTGVPAVGDALRDIQAALEVGARPILVRTGKGRRTLASAALPETVQVYDNLDAVARMLVELPS